MPAFAEPVGEVHGAGRSIREVVVVGQVGVAVVTGLELSHGELILAEETETGQNVGFARSVLVAAGDGVVSGSGGAHVGAGLGKSEERPREEVLGLDRVAVVEHEVLLDGELVGHVAGGGVFDSLVLVDDGIVEDVVAVLVGRNGCAVVGQRQNGAVRRIVGAERSMGPVAACFGAGTDDDLPGGLGASASGERQRGEHENSQREADYSTVQFHGISSSIDFLDRPVSVPRSAKYGRGGPIRLFLKTHPHIDALSKIRFMNRRGSAK